MTADHDEGGWGPEMNGDAGYFLVRIELRDDPSTYRVLNVPRTMPLSDFERVICFSMGWRSRFDYRFTEFGFVLERELEELTPIGETEDNARFGFTPDPEEGPEVDITHIGDSDTEGVFLVEYGDRSEVDVGLVDERLRRLTWDRFYMPEELQLSCR